MNFRRCTFKIASIFLAVVVASTFALAGRNTNPTVLPIDSNPHGQSYGNWGGEWWAWALGVPLDSNPIEDATGEFGDIDQSGRVWFLAGNFGGESEREVTIPPGKALFFPLINSVWWAPDDVEIAAFVVDEFLGLDPDDFTDEELIALTAVFQVTFETLEMTCSVDGVEHVACLPHRERCGGLIEQQHLCAEMHRSRDGDRLPFSSRQGPGGLFRGADPGQAQLGKCLLGLQAHPWNVHDLHRPEPAPQLFA